MTEEIYGDVLFLINFSMDFISLYLAGKILHDPMRAWRLILAASVGGIYGVAALFYDLGSFWNTVVALAVAMLMVAFAYSFRTWRGFLAALALFAAIAMLLGGIMTAVFVRLGRYGTYMRIGGSIHTVYGDLPIWLFLVLAAVSALLTWLIGRIFAGKRHLRTCELSVTFEGKETVLTGLIDSGNLLEEPISGTPVIIVKDAFSDFLPEAVRAPLRDGVSSFALGTAGKFRLVPSRTVAGEGILLAAVPERCALRCGKVFEERRALLALDSTGGDFGGFPALIPEAIL